MKTIGSIVSMSIALLAQQVSSVNATVIIILLPTVFTMLVDLISNSIALWETVKKRRMEATDV